MEGPQICSFGLPEEGFKVELVVNSCPASFEKARVCGSFRLTFLWAQNTDSALGKAVGAPAPHVLTWLSPRRVYYFLVPVTI